MNFKFEKLGGKLMFHHETKGTAYYDLADGQCYVNGRKNKELNRFFAKTAACTIIEHICEQNPHYGALLKFVYSKCNHGTTNIGRVFNLLRENYMGMESYYALDIYLDAHYYGSTRWLGNTFKKFHEHYSLHYLLFQKYAPLMVVVLMNYLM